MIAEQHAIARDSAPPRPATRAELGLKQGADGRARALDLGLPANHDSRPLRRPPDLDGEADQLQLIRCVYDPQIPLDEHGYYAIVISRAGDRPKNATLKCGVAYIPWPPTATATDI